VLLHNWDGVLNENFLTFSWIHLTSTARRIDSRYQNSANTFMPLPVAARSKMWVCRHPLFGIAGSNPGGGMDVSLSVVCCQVQVSVTADGLAEESYRVCLCMCVS